MNTIWLDLLGAEVRQRGNTYQTRCLEFGAGTPLILIHGVGGHAEAYSRNLRALGSAHHAMSIDLLWHGLSSKPPFTPDMVPEYCKQILDLLDSMGAPKASIEGESLGGWIATYFALHYPERVDRLILNTTAGIKYDETAVKIDHAGGGNLLRERSMAAIKNPNRETIRKRLEWLMASPDRVTDELVELRYSIYTRPDTQASLTNVFENSFQGSQSPRAIPEGDLAKIKAPTLVLWSDKNPGAGPDAGKRVQSLIPGSQYFCITDAAHWPQWEQPKQHDDAVLAFLAGKTFAFAEGSTRG
jgi:pimeloyl-ACP methyl ester carboxylesterase